MDFFRQLLVTVCAVAFFGANLAGAHLHLCFDGQEPSSELHVFDGEQAFHHLQTSEKHDDVDIDLTNQALAKFFKSDVSSPALFPSWKVPAVNLVAVFSRSIAASAQALASTSALLPPSCGPPV